MTKEQALEQIKKLSQELTAKFKAGVFDAAAYSAAYNKLNDALYLLNHDKSPDTVIASVQSVKDLLSSGMTQEEYDKQKSAMYKKYKDGEITNYAYIQWKKQNNPANQPKSGAVSAPVTAKAQTPAPKKAAPVAAKNAGKTAEDILGFKIPDLISDTTNYTNILIAALNGGTITQAQYDQAIKKVIAGSKKWQKQNAAPAGMTQAEYDAAKSEMYKKYKNGEITNYAYIQWKKQNNPENQAGNGAPATSATKGGASAGTGTKAGNGAITKAQSDAIKDLLDNAVDNGELSPNASVEKKKMLLQMKNDGKTYDEIAAALGVENGKLKNKAITESEWKGLQAELQKQYADLKISWDKFNDLAFDLKQVYQNGGTLEEAKQLIQGKPQTGMTDAEKDTLTNIINAHATGGTIDYDDANALFDMVDKMQKDGKNTTEALQTINSVVDMIDQNGMTAEDAIASMNLGAGAATGGMSIKDYTDLLDEIQDMVDDGDITPDEQQDFIEELEKLNAAKIGYNDAQNVLTTMANGIPAEFAEKQAGVSLQAAGKKQTQKAMTHDEYIKLWEELNKQKKAGKITPEKYKEYGDSLDAMYAQKATLDAAKQAIHMVPMTGDEMLEIGKQLSDKYNAGKITWDEFNAMNDTVMNMKAQNATLADVQAAVGLDPGSLAKEKAIDDLEAELKDVYGQAAKEMQKAWDDFSASYAERLNKKYQDYQDGKITKDEYDEWVKGQMAKSDQMLAQIDQLTGVVSNANKKAMGMINGEQLGVFAENANWQAYKLTKDANMNLTFAIYDEHTVEKLIRDKPELLPRKQLNGKKDAAWNQDKIAKSMVQGILQGESIPKLARRVAIETAGTNMNAMVRYARTAMVAAQNSGRMEMLHRAEGMGIKCKKCWLATLDSRTRDSHQKMDGVTVGIDEKFPNGLMYPGDPNGNQAEVWNCRCTLTYEYEGYPADPANNERRDNESGDLIADMDYQEWKAAKKGSELNNLNIAKVHLAEVQKSYVKNKVSETKKYEGIWKEPVTLADYPDKKASIAAKRDYYVQEIQKYKDAQANGESWATDEKIKDLEKKLKQLNEFEQNGGILEKRNAALKAVQDIYDKVGLQKKAEAPDASEPKAPSAKKAEKKGKGLSMLSQEIVDALADYTGGEELQLNKEQMKTIKSAMDLNKGKMWRVESISRIGGSVSKLHVGDDFDFSQLAYEAKEEDLGALRSFTKGKSALPDLVGQVDDAVIFETVGDTYQLNVESLSQYDQKESLCFANQWKIAGIKTMTVDGRKYQVVQIEQKKNGYPQQTAKMSLSTAGAKATPFSPDAYSKERKDKALWTTDKRKVDDIMRKKTGEMWNKASREERIAIHEYTYTYKKFNEPLRGIEYGTSRYLGVGKTDLNAGSKRSGRKLNAITDLLDRCSYDHDMWLNRGVRFGGMDKFFNVPMDLLENGTESQLQKALIGTTPTEYAFGSMGSAKGEGFSGDIIMNIYAPKGTKMLFAEPWSYYGRDKNGRMHDMEGVNWNGKDTQPSYGTEFETILQQGTQFRVTKVTRRGKGTIFVDLEVINQDNQQRWKP